MTTLELSAKDPARLSVTALVVGLTTPADSGSKKGPKKKAADVTIADGGVLPQEALNALQRAASAVQASAAVDSLTRVPAPAEVKAEFVLFTGLGSLDADESPSHETLRRAAGAATRSLEGMDSAAIALPVAAAEQVAAVAEGALLGAYVVPQVREARTGTDAPEPKAPITAVTICTSRLAKKAAKEADALVARATILAAAVHGARDLVNLSPNVLYPETFADQARKLAKGKGVKVTVLDESALKSGGYGGIIGVGQGSVRPPRLVKVAYTPAKAKKHVALIGKGITFDTGGISLKPAAGMDEMKMDMAGAAVVLHTVLAAAQLNLPVRVTAWLALAENMPSGTAQRPADVITIRGGKTVEVLNTDAEGRLVMADALVAATEEKPDLLVDIATLTGAQMVALGNRVGAIMGTDDAREAAVAAAGLAGEQFWPMPLPEELKASMKSHVADIANIGDRFGGMLVAGLFLQEFTADLPWAHLDIAGPAYNNGSPRHYEPKGGTGVGVRTLLTLLEESEQN